MKKSIALLTALLLAASSAQANVYSDNNPADVYLNIFNPSYTGEFTLDGYNPATETITWAHAEFTFWDLPLLGGPEAVKVDMSGDLFTSGSFGGWLVLGGAGDNVINAWVTLDTTGALSYTVSRTSGGLSEFWLKNAYLEVETGPRNVPDAGATSVLLGLGLMLVLGAKRRFKAVR